MNYAGNVQQGRWHGHRNVQTQTPRRFFLVAQKLVLNGTKGNRKPIEKQTETIAEATLKGQQLEQGWDGFLNEHGWTTDIESMANVRNQRVGIQGSKELEPRWQRK